MSGITYYKMTFGEYERQFGLLGVSLTGDDPDLTVMAQDYVRDELRLRNGRIVCRSKALNRHERDVFYDGVLDDWAKDAQWTAPESWKLVMHE